MILVTGATGFVGCKLVYEAISRGINIRVVIRNENTKIIPNVDIFRINGLNADTIWKAAFKGVEIIIHAAARVHVMNDRSADPVAEFRKINVAGTMNLARQAVAAGVKRFVFVSSVKVNGEFTLPGQLFKPDDTFVPDDPYGLSKYEAEAALRELAAETGLEVVIVRPTLVYGPGVKANFSVMVNWLKRGIPLPLGAVVNNRRSLVALDNLVDLLLVCSTHPAAVNQTFMASDGEDVSTAELLRRMGLALGKSARLLPVPVDLLKLSASMLGKSDVAQRLLGSLQVDISKNQRLLDWVPPLSLDEGLIKVALNA